MRRVHNATIDGDSCKSCRFFTAQPKKVYGRCRMTPMVTLDSMGQPIPDTERQAARFETDWCMDFIKG